MKALLQKIMSEMDWDGLDFFMSENADPKDFKGTPLSDLVPAYLEKRQELEMMLRALCEEYEVECKL